MSKKAKMKESRPQNEAANPNLISIKVIKEDQVTEDDANEEDTENSLSLPKVSAVDGGYGWMVVLGTWIMHIMLGGWNRYFFVFCFLVWWTYLVTN